jgi:hypothetical protein
MNKNDSLMGRVPRWVVIGVTTLAWVALFVSPSHATTIADLLALKGKGDSALIHLLDDDIATGSAMLAEVVHADTDLQLPGYRTILSNWINYFTPLDEVLADVPVNTLIKWRGRYYFKGSSSELKILPEGEMLAASLDHDKKYLIIVQQRLISGNSDRSAYENSLELYDLKDFSIKANHIIPINVYQILQPQWQNYVLLQGSMESSYAGGLVGELYSLNLETGELVNTEATRFVFDSRCTSLLWEEHAGTASVIEFDTLAEGLVTPEEYELFNLEPSINKARESIAQGSDEEETKANLNNYIMSVISEHPQSLLQTDYHTFVATKAAAAGMIEENRWSGDSEGCESFVLNDMANEPDDEENADALRHNSFYQFNFPSLRPEKELWNRRSEEEADNRLLMVEDKGNYSSLKDFKQIFRWSKKEEKWVLKDWQEIEKYSTNPAWAGHLPKPLRMDLYQSSFLSWEPAKWLRSKLSWMDNDYQVIRDLSVDGDYLNILFAGGGGAQYGLLTICRVPVDELQQEKSANTACFNLEYHGNYGAMAFSEDHTYGYIQNLQYMGFNSFDLVDLRQNTRLELPITPSGEGPLPAFAAFNENATMFVVFNGDFWVYSRSPNERTFTFSNRYAYGDLLIPGFDRCGTVEADKQQALVDGITFIDDHLLLAVRRDGQLLAIDGNTGGIVWSARDGLPVTSRKQIIHSAESGLFVLQNQNGLRVFLKKNAAPLSRFLQFSDLLSEEKQDSKIDPATIEVTLEGHNRVLVGINGQYWFRDFTITEDKGDRSIEYKNMTGFERDGHGGIRPMARLF